jgi:hypothetical protein
MASAPMQFERMHGSKKMGAEQTFSVQQALDVIEHMPLEDQMTVIEVLVAAVRTTAL